MKYWRCPSPQPFCGSCGKLLGKSEPVLVITLSGVPRPKVRCEACAGEPIDQAQLADGLERAPLSSRGEVMQRLAEILPEKFTADWKIAQSAERDE